MHKLTFLKASECSGHSGTNRYSVFMFNQTLKNTFYYCKSHICWKAPESSVQLLPEGVLVSRNLAKVSMIHCWYGKCDEMRLPGFELQELYLKKWVFLQKLVTSFQYLYSYVHKFQTVTHFFILFFLFHLIKMWSKCKHSALISGDFHYCFKIAVIFLFIVTHVHSLKVNCYKLA